MNPVPWYLEWKPFNYFERREGESERGLTDEAIQAARMNSISISPLPKVIGQVRPSLQDWLSRLFGQIHLAGSLVYSEWSSVKALLQEGTMNPKIPSLLWMWSQKRSFLAVRSAQSPAILWSLHSQASTPLQEGWDFQTWQSQSTSCMQSFSSKHPTKCLPNGGVRHLVNCRDIAASAALSGRSKLLSRWSHSRMRSSECATPGKCSIPGTISPWYSP